MKNITWFWPFITTLICFTQILTALQSSEYEELEGSTLVQNDFLLEKRLKPSLSIVNPLDVLRQRLMLESARRQQREQDRQVEINRQILRQVGKRKDIPHYNIFDFLHKDKNKFDINENIDNEYD